VAEGVARGGEWKREIYDEGRRERRRRGEIEVGMNDGEGCGDW